MKSRLLPILLLFMIIAGCQPKTVDYLQETKTSRDARMQWWRDARFGMFIHWGLYAVPAGEWKGQTNHAEWIRETARIPLEEYDKFVGQFNPVKFNADDWVKMAKDAGMKYIVITSKHHDGFGLFNSKQTEFDVLSTPFKRDILKELSKACEKEDMTFCFYHSIMDWHHPDYLPRRSWETTRSAEGADFDRYRSYMKAQLKELLTRYGKIGVLWFDGEWENTWTSDYGKDLYNYVRNLQPDIIINNRVTVGRSGLEGMTAGNEFSGDFGTPEQEIPATGIQGADWESCMTMNDHWGYNKNDKNFKTAREILRMLADISSKGGNYLLNIGPTADGVFPQESIDRLKEIGKWMKTNGEAIYNTQASPFKFLPWGRCTQKKMTESTRLYLHVFDWPADGKLIIPGLGNKVIRAFLLSEANQEELPATAESGSVNITVPSQMPDATNTIVVLDIEGDPAVFDAPEISASGSIFIDQTEVTIAKNESISEIRYTLDGSLPNAASSLYSGPVRINETITITASCFKDGKAMSGNTVFKVSKVKPAQGRQLSEAKQGLLFKLYRGDWDRVPDFNGLTPNLEGIANDFGQANKASDENFSIDYQGFINIPSDGIYTLSLNSDDGSNLYVSDKLVIDNDGLHGPTEKSAELALGKGLHSIRLTFLEKTGGNSLELKWKSGNGKSEPVPASALMYYR
ncbi:MAG: alpha-L-fucosidase [Bacteroidales bacterium]